MFWSLEISCFYYFGRTTMKMDSYFCNPLHTHNNCPHQKLRRDHSPHHWVIIDLLKKHHEEKIKLKKKHQGKRHQNHTCSWWISETVKDIITLQINVDVPCSFSHLSPVYETLYKEKKSIPLLLSTTKQWTLDKHYNKYDFMTCWIQEFKQKDVNNCSGTFVHPIPLSGQSYTI